MKYKHSIRLIIIGVAVLIFLVIGVGVYQSQNVSTYKPKTKQLTPAQEHKQGEQEKKAQDDNGDNVDNANGSN